MTQYRIDHFTTHEGLLCLELDRPTDDAEPWFKLEGNNDEVGDPIIVMYDGDDLQQTWRTDISGLLAPWFERAIEEGFYVKTEDGISHTAPDETLQAEFEKLVNYLA